MVEHGARELIYLSRSAGASAEDTAFVVELQSMGCAAKLVRGDVTRYADVENAVASGTNPLRGVLQMSMVLRDQNFTTMPYDEWSQSVESAPGYGGRGRQA